MLTLEQRAQAFPKASMQALLLWQEQPSLFREIVKLGADAERWRVKVVSGSAFKTTKSRQ